MKNKQVKIAIDRGNGTTKVVCSIDGSVVEPFKIPSVIRKVTGNPSTTRIGSDTYLVGKSAFLSKEGRAETPFSNEDKITDLAVVIANALHEVLKQGQPLTLDVGVASPLNSSGALTAIRKEVERLRKGFSVGNQTYQIDQIDRVISFREGAEILNTNPDFNVAIDIGFGTILAYYRDESGVINEASLIDGEAGGVHLLIDDLRRNDSFRDAVRRAGYNASPSIEVLASIISKGSPYKLKEENILPCIQLCAAPLVQRVNEALEGVYRIFAKRAKYDIDFDFAPVVIGGGAALLRAVQSDKLKLKLVRDAVLFDSSPDYQTALIIHQNLVTTPIEVQNNVKRTEAAKNQKKPVHGKSTPANVDAGANTKGQTDENGRESDRSVVKGGETQHPKQAA